MKSIASISAASLLLAVSYPAFAQAPTPDQTKPPPSVSAPMMQGQAPGAMQPGAMPMGDMPMMQGQPGMVQSGGMPCMQGQTGMMRPGMMMSPAMMQEHMQRMEAHRANMETLLRQLVELQQKK